MVSELQEITHKQFNAIRKIIQEQNKMYNKEIEKLKKYQTNFGADQYNHWTKEFNESFNSRLDKVTERIGDIEDKAVDLTQQSSKKITRILQNEDILKDL